MVNKKQRPIISDVQPRSRKTAFVPPPAKPRVEIKKVFARREVEGPRTVPPPRSRRRFSFSWAPSNRMRLIGFVAVLAVALFYFWWSARLLLVISPQRTAFDLGENGVAFTFGAQEFSKEILKEARGESTESREYSEQAKGTVIVYNDFSADPQILVQRTRLETPGGLIFRTSTRVVVPGKKGAIPGSVEVEVFGDEPGDKYNIGLSDFKIPGFRGSPKYDKFYARSKTPMQGGGIGQGKVVGESEANALLAELESHIQREYIAELRESIPVDFVSFPNEFDLEIVERTVVPPIGSPGETFQAKIVARARTLGVPEKDFDEQVGNELFKDQKRKSIYRLDNESNISFSDILMNYAAHNISLKARGKVEYIGDFDVEELRGKILKAGSTDELDTIFESYPGISKVEKTFRPAFIRRIPWRAGGLIIEVE